MPSEPLPIEGGISPVRRPSRPDPTTTITPAHVVQDIEHAKDIESCLLLSNACKLQKPHGMILQSTTDGAVSDFDSFIQNPDTGHFVYGMICLALARSHDSVVLNRYHYAILALHHLRKFSLENNLSEDHFNLMNDTLEDAQALYDSLRAAARARNPPFQEAPDAMDKWRQGTYFQSPNADEEPIFPLTPHHGIAADPMSTHMSNINASQETLVETNMGNSADGAESPKKIEDEDDIVDPGSPPKKSDSLNEHMETLKLGKEEETKSTNKWLSN